MSYYRVSEYGDVCYYAKIRILKQITTIATAFQIAGMMFVIMQR